MLSEQVCAMRTSSHAMQCNENITPTDARHKTQKKKKQMQGIFLEQTRQNSQLTNFASLRFESSCKSIHGYNTCPKLSEEAAQAPHTTPPSSTAAKGYNVVYTLVRKRQLCSTTIAYASELQPERPNCKIRAWNNIRSSSSSSLNRARPITVHN